jgi:hypothetical protein
MKHVTLLSVILKVFHSTFTKLIKTNVTPQSLKLSFSYWVSVYGLRVHCAQNMGGQKADGRRKRERERETLR